MLDALTTLLEAGAAAPWVLAVVLLIAVGDALLPPVPSEGVVVALAAVAVGVHGPHPVLLGLSEAVGAILGDVLTFIVSRRYGPQRLDRVTRPRARHLLERSTTTLERRGAGLLTARYVPLGRVAVNLTRRCHRFPGRRFTALAALAAATWATWSGAVGVLAGRWLDGNPLLGSALGVALALGLRLAVDRVARRLTGWARTPAPGIRRRARGRGRRPGPQRGSRPTARLRLPTGRRAVCTLHPRVPIMALALSW